jgi:hypothetical protein
MGAGSTLDSVSACTTALSLDASAGGGTIDKVFLNRALALPNGVTTVNNLYGYAFSLPFGSIAAKMWALYSDVDCYNWVQGSFKVGGTPGLSDFATNSSVGIEIESTTKAFLNARMTQAQRDALTALNGMQVYNTDTDKLQVYAAGAWVDLH